MDFLTGLPLLKNYNDILVLVNCLTKMRHLIPCNTKTGSEELARLYLHPVWEPHGLPKTIISNRGTQFTSNLWKHLCLKLKIKTRLFSAFHHETDRHTVRFNLVREQYLRSFVSYQQDN